MKNRIPAISFALQVFLLFNSSLLHHVLAAPSSRGVENFERAVATRGLTGDGTAPSNERLSGIVICEPVVPENDNALADFGAGCGRWLFWAVGGLPDLGATPAWSEVNENEGRLGRKNLRLPVDRVDDLARTLGVNRVATGEINGDAQSCTLTYQVHQTVIERDEKFNPLRRQTAPLGELIVVTGAREQIVLQLPEVARQILQRCGMKDAPQFAAAGATPDELMLCGLVQTEGEIPNARREEFLQLAARLPLANLLTALYDDFDDEKTAAAAAAQNLKWFLQQAPNNTLMIGEMIPLDEETRREYSQALANLRLAFPDNYNIARAAANWRVHEEDLDGARADADVAVNAALFNPFAHLLQAELVAAQAQALRQGRMSADITAREWEILRLHYLDWFIAATRATRLDLQSSAAWTEAATAAIFFGSRAFAEYALDRALDYDPKNLNAYRWGLQMYQPKWTDKGSKKLNELVGKAMQDEAVFMMLYEEILKALGEDPQSVKDNASAAVSEKALGVLRKAAMEHPEIMELHLEIATILIARPPTLKPEEAAEARRHLERALEIEPESAVANYQMAMLFKVHLKDDVQAEKYLRRAAELDPDAPAPQTALEQA